MASPLASPTSTSSSRTRGFPEPGASPLSPTSARQALDEALAQVASVLPAGATLKEPCGILPPFPESAEEVAFHPCPSAITDTPPVPCPCLYSVPVLMGHRGRNASDRTAAVLTLLQWLYQPFLTSPPREDLPSPLPMPVSVFVAAFQAISGAAQNSVAAAKWVDSARKHVSLALNWARAQESLPWDPALGWAAWRVVTEVYIWHVAVPARNWAAAHATLSVDALPKELPPWMRTEVVEHWSFLLSQLHDPNSLSPPTSPTKALIEPVESNADSNSHSLNDSSVAKSAPVVVDDKTQIASSPSPLISTASSSEQSEMPDQSPPPNESRNGGEALHAQTFSSSSPLSPSSSSSSPLQPSTDSSSSEEVNGASQTSPIVPLPTTSVAAASTTHASVAPEESVISRWIRQGVVGGLTVVAAVVIGLYYASSQSSSPSSSSSFLQSSSSSSSSSPSTFSSGSVDATTVSAIPTATPASTGAASSIYSKPVSAPILDDISIPEPRS